MPDSIFWGISLPGASVNSTIAPSFWGLKIVAE